MLTIALALAALFVGLLNKEPRVPEDIKKLRVL